MKTDLKYHKSLLRKNFIYFLTALLVGALKFLNTLLKLTTRALTVGLPDDSTSTLFTTALPWFNLVMFCSSILFVGYSMYYFGILKEEIKLKNNYDK